MNCVDCIRHEDILTGCTHREHVMVMVRFDDGCSGQVCGVCDQNKRVKFQPDLAERTPGPERAVGLLEILRALQVASTVDALGEGE